MVLRSLLAAWWGSRTLALMLFAVTVAVTVAKKGEFHSSFSLLKELIGRMMEIGCDRSAMLAAGSILNVRFEPRPSHYALALVLAIAFASQLLLGELPCPLCLMQRIQFQLQSPAAQSAGIIHCSIGGMKARFGGMGRQPIGVAVSEAG